MKTNQKLNITLAMISLIGLSTLAQASSPKAKWTEITITGKPALDMYYAMKKVGEVQTGNILNETGKDVQCSVAFQNDDGAPVKDEQATCSFFISEQGDIKSYPSDR